MKRCYEKISSGEKLYIYTQITWIELIMQYQLYFSLVSSPKFENGFQTTLNLSAFGCWSIKEMIILNLQKHEAYVINIESKKNCPIWEGNEDHISQCLKTHQIHGVCVVTSSTTLTGVDMLKCVGKLLVW